MLRNKQGGNRPVCLFASFIFRQQGRFALLGLQELAR